MSNSICVLLVFLARAQAILHMQLLQKPHTQLVGQCRQELCSLAAIVENLAFHIELTNRLDADHNGDAIFQYCPHSEAQTATWSTVGTDLGHGGIGMEQCLFRRSASETDLCLTGKMSIHIGMQRTRDLAFDMPPGSFMLRQASIKKQETDLDCKGWSNCPRSL